MFFIISIILAAVFYFLFGIVNDFNHPFTSLKFIPWFFTVDIILIIISYFLVIREDLNKKNSGLTLRTRALAIILSSALIISIVFPVTATFGIYPTSMAIFHLLILYYMGLCFSSILLAFLFTVSIKKIHIEPINILIIIFVSGISLGIAFLTTVILEILPVGSNGNIIG